VSDIDPKFPSDINIINGKVGCDGLPTPLAESMVLVEARIPI
jgi:hypothetical protein